MNENQKVNVTYPDGKGSHETTISELRTKWKEETKVWQDDFFYSLEVKGVAYSRFGKYELLPADVKPQLI